MVTTVTFPIGTKTHLLKEQKGTIYGTRYVAVCGANGYNGHVEGRETLPAFGVCGKCLAKAKKEA